jgi:phospholipid/cholesterol/gamma-HCH transport system permease protein
MTPTPLLGSTMTAERLQLAPAGAWTATHSEVLEQLVDAATPKATNSKGISIDMAGVQELDTLGAWLLERLLRSSNLAGPEAQFVALPAQYRGLIDEMHRVNLQKRRPPAGPNRLWAAMDGVGRATVQLGSDAAAFLHMFGEVAVALGRVVAHPRRFRMTSAVYHLHRVGWQAVPIMALIKFLIGAIIAQQGIFHFRKFGADAHVVDMVGILVLREIGVLIVSIVKRYQRAL